MVKAQTVPSALDLLTELEEMRQVALKRSRMVFQRGIPIDNAEPDVKAAVACTMGKAAILGYIRQTPPLDTPALVADAMRRALRDPDLRALLLEQLRELEPGLLSDGKGSK